MRVRDQQRSSKLNFVSPDKKLIVNQSITLIS
jgi:hypothetical protein